MRTRTVVITTGIIAAMVVFAWVYRDALNVDGDDASTVTRPVQATVCTPQPSLYQDWKAELPGGDSMTDAQVIDYTDRVRPDVIKKKDPFIQIASDTAQGQLGDEWVLWRDSRVLVVVDIKVTGPKALVIPKDSINFIIDIDADAGLSRRLAEVAAATSDAFIDAGGKRCADSTHSRIAIHPPNRLGVRRLHVHVQPPFAYGAAGSAEVFYASVARYLATALGNDR
jgi:hypothetical protein